MAVSRYILLITSPFPVIYSFLIFKWQIAGKRFSINFKFFYFEVNAFPGRRKALT